MNLIAKLVDERLADIISGHQAQNIFESFLSAGIRFKLTSYFVWGLELTQRVIYFFKRLWLMHYKNIMCDVWTSGLKGA